MNRPDPIDTPEPTDRAAAYVLGTLDAADMVSAQTQMQRDREFAREVYRWQDRLAPLYARIKPLELPRSLLDRILARIQPSRHAAATRRALRVWQWVAAGSFVLMLALGIRVWQSEPSMPHYIAVLHSPEHQAVWVVELVDEQTLRLKPVGPMPSVPPQRALQFWTKPENADKPTSLGLVRAGESVLIPRAALPAVETQQLFEITLEAEYGSPTGLPTGPILAIGRMVSL